MRGENWIGLFYILLNLFIKYDVGKSYLEKELMDTRKFTLAPAPYILFAYFYSKFFHINPVTCFFFVFLFDLESDPQHLRSETHDSPTAQYIRRIELCLYNEAIGLAATSAATLMATPNTIVEKSQTFTQ